MGWGLWGESIVDSVSTVTEGERPSRPAHNVLFFAEMDPDGGLDDDYDDALAASWGDEAWDDADVY